MSFGHPDWDKYRRAYAQIVARAWRDEEWKNHFLEDPGGVLEEYGVPIHGIPREKIKAYENKRDEYYIVLPTRPDFVDLLTDENLGPNLNAAITSGAQFGCITFTCAC